MERISSLFLMGYAQRSRTSFFNTCMKNNSLFWPINVEISFNTKTPGHDLEPRFRLKGYFHIYWSKSQIFFRACVEEGCSASLCIAHEKKPLKSFPFKVVLSWKQCSCDVIIERVYWLEFYPWKLFYKRFWYRSTYGCLQQKGDF
jgi:hypothetical protein